MAASNLYLKVPTTYEPSPIREIIQALCNQLDTLSTGQSTAKFSSLNVTPSGAVAPHAVSDIIYDASAAAASSIVPGLPIEYVRLGWIWTTSGTPGTFKEIRVPTGALTNSVPNNVALAGDGAGGFKFRTLTSADVPAAAGFSVSGQTTVLGAAVTLSATASYFDGPFQSVVAGTGTYYCSGGVTLSNITANGQFYAKLWDGTTVIASGSSRGSGNGADFTRISLSGIIVNPAGNIKISVREVFFTNEQIVVNATGNGKDSNLTLLRLG